MSNLPPVSETLNQPDSATSAESTNTLPVATPAVAEAPAPEARVESAPSNDAKPAASSSNAGDKDANKKATLLEVVKNGLNADKPDSGSSTEGDKRASAELKVTDEQGVQDESQAQKEDPNKAAEKLPFHNHPRWKEVNAKLKEAEPAAEQYRKITNFMETNHLSQQEMVDGFKIMAMMKQEPAEAYKALKGYVDKLAPLAGEILPDELKRRVDDGFDSPETAQELARLRAKQDFEVVRQREMQQRQEQQQVVERQTAIVSAVESWEKAEEAKDPDWSAKYEMVNDRVMALLRTERPASPSDAIEIARRALSDVNARLRPLAGRSTPIKSPTSSLSSASTRPAPRSLDDVVRLGLLNS
jgi:hypothetical protein